MTGLEGQTLAGYHIMAELGHGGMGAVYKARQPVLVRLVALKLITPHLAAAPGYIARLHHEAAAAAKFNHPNIVQIYTAGESDGRHFIVMEYVEGESVQARLSREKAIEPCEALAICTYVAEALKYGWERARIIHRDVKPDNIFLSNEGEVKLGDLGLAKSAAEGSTSLTAVGEVLGTPHYCSPEQAQAEKDIDCRSDIYSLGCTLFHMLSGKPPYADGGESSPLAIILKQVAGAPPDIVEVMPECPPSLVALLAKMLAKNPDDRYQDYQELLAAMKEAYRGLADCPRLEPPAPPAAEEPEMGKGRSPALQRAALAFSFAAVVAGAVWGATAWSRRAGSMALPPLAATATARAPEAVTLPPIAAGNLLQNGDFHEREGDGSPARWKASSDGEGTVGNDQEMPFLRVAGSGPGETHFIQYVDRPPGIERLGVSVRLRSHDFQAETGGEYGLVIAQRNAAGELLARDACCVSKMPFRNWKTIATEIDLQPAATTLAVKLLIERGRSTVDFADVVVAPR